MNIHEAQALGRIHAMKFQLEYIHTRVGVIRDEQTFLPEDVGHRLDLIMLYAWGDVSSMVKALTEVMEHVESLGDKRSDFDPDLSHELHSIWDAGVVGLKAFGIDVLAEKLHHGGCRHDVFECFELVESTTAWKDNQ